MTHFLKLEILYFLNEIYPFVEKDKNVSSKTLRLQKTLQEERFYYDIISLHENDLIKLGFITKDVTARQLELLASDLAKEYKFQLFNQSLVENVGNYEIKSWKEVRDELVSIIHNFLMGSRKCDKKMKEKFEEAIHFFQGLDEIFKTDQGFKDFNLKEFDNFIYFINDSFSEIDELVLAGKFYERGVLLKDFIDRRAHLSEH